MSSAKIAKIDPLHPKEEYLRQAADVIKRGGLVILPTETVYGIGANMLDKRTIARLCEIKQRPPDKPFSLHIDNKESIEDFAIDIPVSAYKLIEEFWPGPLTVILKSKDGKTIGIRMPDNAIASRLIHLSAVPVVCPSANISATPPPITFEQAIRDLKELVDFAIDAGDTRLGVESTVVDLTAEPIAVLREAAIKTQDIETIAKTKIVLFVCTGNSCRSVMAEALLEKKLREKNRNDVLVLSAGIILSGLGPTGPTREILRREGIDVSGHRSRRISPDLIKKSDIILVMEKIHEEKILGMVPSAKNRVFLLKEFAKIGENNVNIDDPIARSKDFYEYTFGVIKEAVERVVRLL